MNIRTTIISDEVPLDEDGFHWRAKGKKGVIYYVENGRLIPIYAKVPSDTTQFDILVFGKPDHLQHWEFPEKEKIAQEKSLEIHQKLAKWLKARRWRHDFCD
ncbi:MAG: hypothetical protein PWR01_4462 [Clostridiales bacterium]|jgi:hypothetical protein|nr:hypothetical protein [Clostridiales bacterium]MDN5283389.1 hypothetical protein [Candidatus Ozemobacter sp.]